MSLPKPYYQDSAVTIYHGDCRDILPQLPKVDLVLTDPPYIGLKGGTEINLYFKGQAKKYSRKETVGDIWQASLDWLPVAWEQVTHGMMVFCSFHSVAEIGSYFPNNRLALITWQQPNGPPSVNNVPHFTTEYIWAFAKTHVLDWRSLETYYVIPKLTAGCITTGERYLDENKCAIHPTQKPLQLMKSLLSVEPDIILDPFAGTGTTGRAAKDLSRKAILIEIEEKYCEIAAKRMSQTVMNLSTHEGE